MEFIKNIVKFFSKPYPLDTDQNSQRKIIIFITIFPIVFFILFKPFGIIPNSNDLKIFLAIAGFGLVTGLVTYLYSIVIPFIFKELLDNVTISSAVLYYLGLFICIALGIYIYKSALEGFDDFSLEGLWIVTFRTFIIGIIPLVVVLIWHRNKKLRENLEIAKKINSKVSKVEATTFKIYSENRKEVIQLPYRDFLFIVNADNYIEVFYMHGDIVKSKIVRSNLKNVEEVITVSFVVRCHRSYIVNLKKVIHASGNSKGLLLELEHCKEVIPVSKRYVDTVSRYLISS